MDTTNGTQYQLSRLMLGHILGRGCARVVYACPLMPEIVIKVEEGNGSFQNIMEWEVWRVVQGTPASKWFAECKYISPDGSVLVQERTRTPGSHEFPAKIPRFFTDLKRTNFGMARSAHKDGSEGREYFVCHDYGTNLIMEEGLKLIMKNAKWWDADQY